MKKILLVLVILIPLALTTKARNIEPKKPMDWTVEEYYPIYLATQKTNSKVKMTNEQMIISLTTLYYFYGMLQTLSLLASEEENECLNALQKSDVQAIMDSIMYNYKIGAIDGKEKLFVYVLSMIFECRKTNLAIIYELNMKEKVKKK